MHIKIRGQRAMLYRSAWIKKGAEGNSHGFSRQTFVGSLPADALEIQDQLAARLSNEEASYVQTSLVQPAIVAYERRLAQAEHSRRDPVWRLDEATKLVREAASLSTDAVVPHGRIKVLTDVLATVKSFGGTSGALSQRPDLRDADPLEDALKSIRAAARAVRDGHYGHAPVDGARRSKIYEVWLEISREIDGTGGSDVLLRALQSRGWVKARGAVAR
ncbi:MAG: hypothetical protein PSV40_15710 [Polaromonas sp.]|uniref:hypothetical protein n=1 Tax=Polaromonas sp. TaxID=1869339 RepID=UPI00248A88BC|nr:hypothetical protein [Polaromonas sp.]MDI1270534.1 hypothetical protein [Polaromonas sp.]